MRSTTKRFIYIVADMLWGFSRLWSKRQLSEDKFQGAEIHICLNGPLGLGDLIMLSPFVLQIERTYPENRIVLITKHPPFISFDRAEWVKPNSIDRKVKRLVLAPMLAFSNIREMVGADWYLGYFFSERLVSNFTTRNASLNSAKGHYLERSFPLMEELGIPVTERFEYPRLVSKDTFDAIQGEYVCIAPYVNWMARQYPYDYFSDIVRWTVESLGKRVVIIGGRNEDEIRLNANLAKVSGKHDNVVDFTGRLSLEQSISVIKKAAVYLGNDSGPSHIAFLEANKSVVIFGSVLPEARLPMNDILKKRIVAIDNRSACSRYPCYDGLEEPRCRENLVCLSTVKPKQVFSAIKSSLNS